MCNRPKRLPISQNETVMSFCSCGAMQGHLFYVLKLYVRHTVNCLAYQSRYRPMFFNCLLLIFEKAQAVSNYWYKPKFSYLLPVFSFIVILLFPCDVLVIDVSCFLFCRTVSLLLWHKSRNHKKSAWLPSLMKNYHKSYLYIWIITECTILANLPVFEIVFAAIIVL